MEEKMIRRAVPCSAEYTLDVIGTLESADLVETVSGRATIL